MGLGGFEESVKRLCGTANDGESDVLCVTGGAKSAGVVGVSRPLLSELELGVLQDEIGESGEQEVGRLSVRNIWGDK